MRRFSISSFRREYGLLLAASLVFTLAGCNSASEQPGAADISQRLTEATTPAELPPDDPFAAASVSGPAEVQAAAKPKEQREPIYNEAADARAEIKAALARAAYDHTRVLVKFGGNWCGWCFKLHDVFHKHPDIAPIIRGEYELVLVDVNTNQDLLKELDPDNNRHGYPWLTVLDADGKVLVNQNTADLERGQEHDPEKVQVFLTKWQTLPRDAEEVVTAGLKEARDQNKHVLVHIGAPSCGWCRVLDRFLMEQRELIALDYVDVKIDTQRMTGGDEVAGALRKSNDGGIPWMAILDSEGTTLVTGDGPNGNIGYPFQPKEIDHFVAMLNQTRKNLSEQQVSTLEGHLRNYAAKARK